MSDSATFEFETAVEILEITETISFLWDGSGGEARIYTTPNSRGRVFCTLDYLCDEPEARPVLTPVLKYIHSIALDGKVYCCDKLPASRSAEVDSMLVTRS